jgi:hypothetical protein
MAPAEAAADPQPGVRPAGPGIVENRTLESGRPRRFLSQHRGIFSMNPKRPATMEEYLYQIDNAVFEAADLRMSMGYDEEEQDVALELLDTLEAQLQELQHQVTDGTYRFENRDLPFMSIVRAHGTQIPFKDLLEYINATHRHGLQGG